jgi:hypothetical protein
VLGVYQRLVAAAEHAYRRDLTGGASLDPEKQAMEREEKQQRRKSEG